MTFRRITARTKLTVPCVFIGHFYGEGVVLTDLAIAQELALIGDEHNPRTFTHWLPFKWPGSGR